MKKFLSLLITATLLYACGPSKKDARKYDDMINTEFERFSSIYTEYAITLNSGNPQTMEEYRVYACNQAVLSLDTISRMKEYEGQKYYVEALKNYVGTILKSMQVNDGPKIRLLAKDSTMTGIDSATVKQLTTSTLYMNDKAYLEFRAAQDNFRKQFGLIEDAEKKE